MQWGPGAKPQYIDSLMDEVVSLPEVEAQSELISVQF